jgi:hypothetical protein
MYYRVAIQADASPTWQWKSTKLSSLNILLQWLQYHRILSRDRLRIFSSYSQEELNEQLERENQGLLSNSVPAIQFLQERRIAPQGAGCEVSTSETRANERMASIAAVTRPSQGVSITSPLDKRREKLERGAGGDHEPLLRGVRQKSHLYWQHESEMTFTLRPSAWSKGGTRELSHI